MQVCMCVMYVVCRVFISQAFGLTAVSLNCKALAHLKGLAICLHNYSMNLFPSCLKITRDPKKRIDHEFVIT